MIKVIAFDLELILQWWHFIIMLAYFVAGIPTLILFMNTFKNHFFVMLMAFVAWPLTATGFGTYILYSMFNPTPAMKEKKQ